MKLTFIITLTCILISAISISQQKDIPGTAVYLELVGKGFISANVDLGLAPKSRLTLGVTMLDHEFEYDETKDEYPTLTLPTPSVMYLHLFGKEKHYFELGAGFSVSPVPWKKYSKNDSPLSLHGSVGYRYQMPDKFFFRAGFTPFYRINWVFLPLAGVSLGYSW